jgi:DNA-binding transcriptional MerR regulator
MNLDSSDGKMDRGREQGFYAGEAAQITGIPYRTMDHWARTGLITPSISAARGSGRSRLYSFKDLLALRVVRDLREKGISVQSLRKVIELLRKTGLDSPLTQAQLLVIGKDVAIVNNTQEIESVLSAPGQLYLTPAMIFDLRKPIADVRREVARFRIA